MIYKKIIQDINHPGHSVLLRLSNGDIHRKSENHTKIKFDSFDIKLFDPIKEETKEKSPLSSISDCYPQRRRLSLKLYFW